MEAPHPLIDVCREAWSFTGLRPAELVDINSFGNVLIRDVEGAVWRICPEELTCAVVAEDHAEFETLRNSDDFLLDWEMQGLVLLAFENLGPLPPNRCYCLKIPAVLGGRYEADNLGTIGVVELLDFSGDVARQIKDLPNGATVEFRISPDHD